MDPLPTLDALLNDAAVGKDRLTRAVESAIANVVAELTAIESFEAASAPESAHQFDRPVSAAVRRLYETWLAYAEPLEARVAAAVIKAGPIEGRDILFRRIARARYRLSESLDEQEQIAKGGLGVHGYTLEEVRRELRLPAKV